MFKLLLKVKPGEATANAAIKAESLQLWHERMCHQAKDHVKNVLQHHEVPFNVNDFFCEGCVFGKQHRLPFCNSMNRAKEPGELVHSDLCGPMQEISFGGARYMLLFRDDFSNYRVVYCIKSKADVASCVEKFLDQVEAETGKAVRCIRSDNGLEYVNKDVDDVLRKRKVIHQKSTPYTPEHNGRAERDMRTVIEAARSMIHAKELSLKYWGEAVQNVVYTLNRTGKTQKAAVTPFELWFKTKADLKVLRVFGSDAYVHVPKEKRRKLNAKSKKGVFVGYEQNCKGYRIWIPAERKIEVSRDVIIKEACKQGLLVCQDDLEVESSVEEPAVKEATPEIVVEDDAESDDVFADGAHGNANEFARGPVTRSKSREIQDQAAICCAYAAESDEPACYEKAMSSEFCAQWKRAMDKKIYMHQPAGYEDGTKRVCKLNKSLYGLKQASRCWNQRFSNMLKSFNLKACSADPCVFVGAFNSEQLILAIYIDDGIIAAQSTATLNKFIEHLTNEFEIKVFESIYYLGIEVMQKTGKLFIRQKAYAEKVLERFGMQDAKAVATPAEAKTSVAESGQQAKYPYREAVGSLMYLSTVTRPDIAYAVSYASRFLDSYKPEHVVFVKRIFRYLRGTLDEGILFEKANNFSLTCYSDSDFAGDSETRRSTGGNVLIFCGGPVSWSSKIQQTVALSTTEAEYMAACEAVKELIWVRRLLNEMSGYSGTPEL